MDCDNTVYEINGLHRFILKINERAGFPLIFTDESWFNPMKYGKFWSLNCLMLSIFRYNEVIQRFLWHTLNFLPSPDGVTIEKLHVGRNMESEKLLKVNWLILVG